MNGVSILIVVDDAAFRSLELLREIKRVHPATVVVVLTREPSPWRADCIVARYCRIAIILTAGPRIGRKMIVTEGCWPWPDLAWFF